ncbi:conserved hypothetical protein [uncultured Gammaproteobacteria bacterium]
MNQLELGQIIAIRDLEFDGNSVRVSIGIPRQEPGGTDYVCPYEIFGPLTKKAFYAMGIDAIQALHLAMKTIDAELDVCAERKTGRLTWLGGQDLGFPSWKIEQ